MKRVWTVALVMVVALLSGGPTGALTFSTFPTLTPGWNLVGNVTQGDVNVAVFSATNVETVWVWDTTTPQTWKFYSPQMTSSELAEYISAKGFEALSLITPGQGFWVNAKTQVPLYELLTATVGDCSAPSMPTVWGDTTVCLYPQDTKVPLAGTLPDTCTDLTGPCFTDAVKNGTVKLVEVSVDTVFAYFRTAGSWHLLPMNHNGSFWSPPNLSSGSTTTEIDWAAGVDGSLKIHFADGGCWLYQYSQSASQWQTSSSQTPCIP